MEGIDAIWWTVLGSPSFSLCVYDVTNNVDGNVATRSPPLQKNKNAKVERCKPRQREF